MIRLDVPYSVGMRNWTCFDPTSTYYFRGFVCTLMRHAQQGKLPENWVFQDFPWVFLKKNPWVFGIKLNFWKTLSFWKTSWVFNASPGEFEAITVWCWKNAVKHVLKFAVKLSFPNFALEFSRKNAWVLSFFQLSFDNSVQTKPLYYLRLKVLTTLDGKQRLCQLRIVFLASTNRTNLCNSK